MSLEKDERRCKSAPGLEAAELEGFLRMADGVLLLRWPGGGSTGNCAPLPTCPAGSVPFSLNSRSWSLTPAQNSTPCKPYLISRLKQ